MAASSTVPEKSGTPAPFPPRTAAGKFKKPSARSEAAGAGTVGATGLTVLFQALPDSKTKNFLLFCVPSFSVVLGVIWFFCAMQARAWWATRKFQREKTETQKFTEEQLRNDSNSPEYKNEVRKNWENFQKSEIDTKFNRLKSLQEASLKFAQTADGAD